MKLSENFSLNELTKSQTATRKGINNTPSDNEKENLKSLSIHILQKIRDHYERPVRVTSGYRSPELCEAIGSSAKSQHAKGEAADFEITGVDNFDLAIWISKNLEFDQLISEFYIEGAEDSGWIHCSYKADGSNRKQCLTAYKENGKTRYGKGLTIIK
jgi:zinc D-Ala-D-Ala carboxypeptidase